jgi:Uma2 family endonuclease
MAYVDPDYEVTVPVPLAARFPVELEPPPGFRAEDPATWPSVEGRLEYVDGRLLFMPPCGTRQQGVAVSVLGILKRWRDAHPEFFVGGNEAGMLLGRDTRGAEAAVWRREVLGPISSKFARVPPLLAVEVSGRDEQEPELRAKAAWYLAHGVPLVWLVLPETHEALVVAPGAESRYGIHDRLPPHPALPGLEAAVASFFDQLD